MQTEPAARETLALLEKLGIEYRYYGHEPARTMADCEGIGADVGAEHFKNLFLSDRRRSVFVLLLLSPEKEFRTGEISRQLGTARLSFCTPEELMEKLGLLPGHAACALARKRAGGHRCNRPGHFEHGDRLRASLHVKCLRCHPAGGAFPLPCTLRQRNPLCRSKVRCGIALFALTSSIIF